MGRKKKKQRAPLTYEKLRNAAKALIQARTGDHVSEAEARRRSEICMKGNNGKKCPCALRAETAEEKLAVTAAALGVPKDFKRWDGHEMICDVCGCCLSLLCVTKRQDLPQHSEDEEYDRPDFCWFRHPDEDVP